MGEADAASSGRPGSAARCLGATCTGSPVRGQPSVSRLQRRREDERASGRGVLCPPQRQAVVTGLQGALEANGGRGVGRALTTSRRGRRGAGRALTSSPRLLPPVPLSSSLSPSPRPTDVPSLCLESSLF